MRFSTRVALFALVVSSALWGVPRSVAGEESVGPFPSWRNLKRDYGAAGDGLRDDTAALQRALDDLVKHTHHCVLYIPAGTYRLTATVGTRRKAHTDCQGVMAVGEDPRETVLKWDGPEGGAMVEWDAWYSRISRLALDGAGRAGTALRYGPAFSTYNETSDIEVRDAKVGIAFGWPGSHGQAENEVLRCKFIRCGVGIQTVNWNSMDVWVWYCLFEDCGRGIYNVMGNWHAWHNLFIRSRIADLSIQNLMVFSVAGNTSIGSRCFLDFRTGHTWGSPTSITANRVIRPTGDWAMELGNAGPYLVADNTFRLAGGRAIRMTWGDQTLVGNRYSKPDAVAERGRFRRVAERVVPPAETDDEPPVLPPTPPRQVRKVFEVPAEAKGEDIQRAINEASKLVGQRPVLHIPMGRYRVEKTLIVPAGGDVQIVGDGAGETASRLEWAGPRGGVVLMLEGPSRATLRDLYIHAPTGRALVVANADQPGGRIFADQLNASGPSARTTLSTAAIRVNGLTRTTVLLRALQGSGNAGRWVQVVGGGGSGDNNVAVFTGATGSAAGQYDVARGGRLVVRGVYHERSSGELTGLYLADSGLLSIDATRFSYATSREKPTILLDGFRGLFTLATSMLLPVETKQTCRVEARGDGSGASVLVLSDLFWVHEPGTTADTVWRNVARPHARGGLVGCNINTSNKAAAPKGFAFLENVGDHPDPARSKYGSGPLADRGRVDDATILRHLAPLRSARAWLPGPALPGATDLRIYRVMATGGHGATVEFRAGR